MDKPSPRRHLGDMPPEEFRAYGHEVIDWIANYLADPTKNPILSRSTPGDIRNSLSAAAPESPTPFDEIFDDFRQKIVPGMTHWNHPGFFAYFGISGAGPGVLAEALTAALNVNAMLWRTSPAATELEELSLDWLRQMLGLPAEFRGHIQDTASTSTMVALAAAREAAGLNIRDEGLAGRELPRLRLYCSEQAHSSVDKSAITLGLGTKGVARIPTDAAYRMSAPALKEALEDDLARGIRPIAVVATLGTTSTTSIDPINEIADICAEYDVWLHVDAAYGGAAALLPELRPSFSGWERADSIVVNPHKWLFVPIDCSALFFRDPKVSLRSYSIVADYLTTAEDGAVTNLMEYGPALGRRFRSLKLWMTLRYFGRVGIAERIAEHIRLARVFAGWVDDDPDWEILAPVPLSTVCFRYRPPVHSDSAIDRINQELLDRVNATGEVFLSHSRLKGALALRLAVGNIRTEERHVARAWELLRDAAESM